MLDVELLAGTGPGLPGDQLQALKEGIMDVMMLCGDITQLIREIQISSRNSIIDITSAEGVIDEAERRLIIAQSYLETDGQNALERAREVIRELGQQSERMTEIARLAREEAVS